MGQPLLLVAPLPIDLTCSITLSSRCTTVHSIATVNPSKVMLSPYTHLLLLLLQAIKADPSRVKDYIYRLDNFDGPAVAEKVRSVRQRNDMIQNCLPPELPVPEGKVQPAHESWPCC
jgi:hypothetical protein